MKKKLLFLLLLCLVAIGGGCLYFGVREALEVLLHFYGIAMLVVLAALVVMRLIPVDHSDLLDEDD